MVNIIYVNEEIRYDKTKLCGWAYKEIKYRVDFKTKKTRFVIYKGYCQRDYEQYDDNNFVETIHIYSEYTHFPIKGNVRYNKDVRKGYSTWKGEIKYGRNLLC